MKDLNYRLQNCPCYMRIDYGLQILILMAMFQLKFIDLPNLVFHTRMVLQIFRSYCIDLFDS
jgi:hypothetical protein